MPPSRANASSRPGGDDLLGVREALGRGELRARVAHVRPPARGAREPAERRRVVHRAEHHQPRRGRVTSTNSERVAELAQLGALGPHQLLGGRRPLAVELVAPEAAVGAAVGAHEQLGAEPRAGDHGDERGAAVLAAMLGELALRAHLWYPSTNTSISPPHGKPNVPRLAVGDPEVQQLGSGAAQHLARDLDDGALDAAAGDGARDVSPCSLTAILAPGARGAERFTPTTVAIATRSPAVHPGLRRPRARPSSESTFHQLRQLFQRC